MPTKKTLTRPPVVTILGHVDHGKTSILDHIRKSNVQQKEEGGITQAIGAYQVSHQDKLITFIDTPGHEAFTSMRSRGGQVADLAVLVVAADDGVMPQTKESIDHIKKAKIPYVVAINKMDLPAAQPDKVKTGLAELGEYVEGYGGNIPFVEVSAKNGQGIDKLLEVILLLAELEELSDNSDQETALGIVIESQLDPHKGPLATILVKQGVFKKNDSLFVQQSPYGKIRTMVSAQREDLKEATPSTPILVCGLSQTPPVGEILGNKALDSKEVKTSSVFKKSLAEIDSEKPTVIIKADVQGSLEAIIDRLQKKINIITYGVGNVTESDIDLAAVNHAQILGFNVSINSSVSKFAQVEKVTFKNFTIIYHLFEFVDELIESTKTPPPPEEKGSAKIIKVFEINGKKVLGAVVVSGKISLKDFVNQKHKVISLQVGKDQVEEVKKDQEFGMLLNPELDIKPGDIIMSYNESSHD